MNNMVWIADDNESIEKDHNKCIECGLCKKVCENVTVALMSKDADKPICINCGQCTNFCPTEALRERKNYNQVKDILSNKDLIKVVSIAPSVRVALGEEFGEIGKNYQQKIVSALKKLGFDYVFDIIFGADLTIMEEASELLSRLKKGETPMFSSCCPAWVKYVEIFYPSLIKNLSTCKSPIAMQGSIIKTYFAKVKKLSPKNIVNIVIAPCTAKKAEIRRKELNSASKFWKEEGICDNDYSLTTRELAQLIKEENIDLNSLEDLPFDSPLGLGSSAGLLFGNSGGVCEAALRTAFYLYTGRDLAKDDLKFNEIRGMAGIKECQVDFDGQIVKVAVANGMKNAKALVDKIIAGEKEYHFVEVMNCTGGCIAGGGQPKITLVNLNSTRQKRMDSIYDVDERALLRLCHKNADIKKLYQDFLSFPGSALAENLLHTSYQDKSYLLKRGER